MVNRTNDEHLSRSPSSSLEVTLTPPDLVEMLKQLDVNVPTGSTMVQIPNSWHRLSCSYRGGELDVLVLHLTRILPGDIVQM